MLTPPALPTTSTKGLEKMEHNVVKIKNKRSIGGGEENWIEVEPEEHRREEISLCYIIAYVFDSQYLNQYEKVYFNWH